MTRKEREAKPVAPCYQRAQKSLFERELQKAARAKARVTNKGRYWSHQSRGERVPMRGAAWALGVIATVLVVGIARASNVPPPPQPVNVTSYTSGSPPQGINVPSPQNLPASLGAGDATGAQKIIARLTLPAGTAAYEGVPTFRTTGSST